MMTIENGLTKARKLLGINKLVSAQQDAEKDPALRLLKNAQIQGGRKLEE
jgi:hypothetical protein